MIMTKETFNKAADLHKRIEHYDKMIDELDGLVLSLDPPTRHWGTLSGGSTMNLLLTQEDVLCIKEAFKKYRDKLNAEFVML
jgi:hypothetical protein